MASCPRLRPPRPLQAKLFFFDATKKNRIGRRTAPHQRPQQAKLFFIAATKIRIGRRAAPPQRTQQTMPFFFDAKKIRIGRGALLRQGRLQQAKPFSPASIPKCGLEIKNQCTKDGVNGENLASIPKSSPEIKNRCSAEAISGQNPAVILKFTPRNQESLQHQRCSRAKTCSDSQVYPLKSRITARWRAFPGKVSVSAVTCCCE